MILRTRLIVLLAFLVLGLSARAHGQIYTWVDANGNRVLSDTRPAESAGPVRTYLVPNSSEPVRVTRAATVRYRDDYEDMIVEEARGQGIRPDLVRAVVQVESGYDPTARSSKGAMGLMQLMPATAAGLGVRRPYDPQENIRGGVAYLRQLLDRYENNEELALAAYNAGPGAVGKYGNRIPPYRETRDYVRRIRTRSGGSGSNAPVRRPIYRSTEIVDGRAVTRYSDSPPAAGSYDVVSPR